MKGIVCFETYQPDVEVDRLVQLGKQTGKPCLVVSPLDSARQVFYADNTLDRPSRTALSTTGKSASFLLNLLNLTSSDYLIRVFPFLNDIPVEVVTEVEKAYLSNGHYAYCLGEEIGLPFLVECLGRGDVDKASREKIAYLPGLRMNLPAHGRVWLDRELRRMFFVDRFDTHFSQPKGIALEISNSCNIACTKCPFHSPLATIVPASSWRMQPKFMPPQIVDKVIEETRNWTASPPLFLCGDGEPLFHPHIEQIVERVASSNLPLSLTTNGVLLEGAIARRLSSASAHIIVSLDSNDPATYRHITGKDYCERVMRNILNYQQAAGNKSNVTLAFVELKGINDCQFDEYRDYWLTKGICVKKIIEMRLLDHAKSYYNDIGIPKVPFPCNQPFLYMRILSDGVSSPCCVTHPRNYSIGDVHHEKITDMWRNEYFSNFRKSFFNYPYFNDHCLGVKCWQWTSSARLTATQSNFLKSIYLDYEYYECT